MLGQDRKRVSIFRGLGMVGRMIPGVSWAFSFSARCGRHCTGLSWNAQFRWRM